MLLLGLLASLLLAFASPRSPAPSVELFEATPSLAFEGTGGQLFPEQARAVRLRLIEVDTVVVGVVAVPLPKAFEAEDRSALEMILRGKEPEEGEKGAKPFWSKRFARPRDSLSEWSLGLDLAALSRSAHGEFLDVVAVGVPGRSGADADECDALRIRKGFLISRLGLFAIQTGGNAARVMALNLATGKPWAGVGIRVLDDAGAVLSSGKTDPRGELRIGIRGGATVVGAIGQEQARMGLAGEDEMRGVVEQDVFGKGDEERPRIFGYLMRGTWRPGDTLVVGAVIPSDGRTNRDVLGIRVQDGSRALVDSLRVPVPRDGHLQLRIPLPPTIATGGGWITLTCGATRKEMPFRVETVRPRRIRVRLDARLDTSGGRPRAVRRLRAEWLSGRPGSGLHASVKGQWFVEAAREPCGIRLLQGRERSLFSRIAAMEVMLDGNGTWTDTLPVPPEMAVRSDANLVLDAEVFEGAGVSVRETRKEAWDWGQVPELRLRMEARKAVLTAGLKDGRCMPVKGAALRLLLQADWVSGSLLDTALLSGDSLAWPLARMLEHLGGARPELALLEAILCKDGEHCTSRKLRLLWPDSGRPEEVSFLPEVAQDSCMGARASGVEPLLPGDPLRISWQSKDAGLALVQVIQGPKELRREWMPVHRGRMLWQGKVEARWDPGVTVVVSEIRRRSAGDAAELVRQESSLFLVRRPDRLLDLSIELADSLRPLRANRVHVVNRSKAPGSVVLSAIDQGILDLDKHRIDDPEAFLDEFEQAQARWWKGLGRFGENWWYDDEGSSCHAPSRGMIGEEEGSRGGRAGLGGGRSACIPRWSGASARTGVAAVPHDRQDSALLRRQGAPFAWTSPVLALPSQGLWVDVPVPAYTGEVRLTAMGVAGHRLGSTQRQVGVRSALEVKATLPQQMAPGDTAYAEIRVLGAGPDATLQLKSSGAVVLLSPSPCRLERGIGYGACRVELMARPEAGTGFLEAIATEGQERMSLPISLEVQESRRMGTERRRLRSQDGELVVDPDGRFRDSGTVANLELSARGVLGTAARLRELLRYPHGCLEQTVSKAYPQLFLEELEPGMSRQERDSAWYHVEVAIARLATFKTGDGLLALWPGGKESDPTGTLHAAEFLLDAKARGHGLPQDVDEVLGSVRSSRRFRSVTERLVQQRFLAREGNADRDVLREVEGEIRTSAQRWMLAQVWRSMRGRMERLGLAKGTADTLARLHAGLAGAEVAAVRELGGSLGSSVVDRARILEAMIDLDWMPGRDTLAASLAEALAGNDYLSTYDMALALRALARLRSGGKAVLDTGLQVQIDSAPWRKVAMVGGTASMALPGSCHKVRVRASSASGHRLEGLLSRSGILREAQVFRDSGLAMELRWERDGRMDSLFPQQLREGEDLVAHVTVRNLMTRKVPNAAFTLWLPGGWEARNPRQDPSGRPAAALLAADLRPERVTLHLDLQAQESWETAIPLRAVIAGRWLGPEAWLEALYDGALQVRRSYGRTVVE